MTDKITSNYIPNTSSEDVEKLDKGMYSIFFFNLYFVQSTALCVTSKITWNYIYMAVLTCWKKPSIGFTLGQANKSRGYWRFSQHAEWRGW
jgi:hypothetical protein